MTSNTEVVMVDQRAQSPKLFTIQAVALSPFKLSNHNSAAFRPLQCAKIGLGNQSSLDHPSKRSGFQLVVKPTFKDKENAPPTTPDQKKRLQSKITRHVEQKAKPPTDAVEAQFTETTPIRKSFALRQFNSILLGRRPALDLKSRGRGSVFQIKSSKPTHCSVTLKGLTIQVKIAN